MVCYRTHMTRPAHVEGFVSGSANNCLLDKMPFSYELLLHVFMLSQASSQIHNVRIMDSPGCLREPAGYQHVCIMHLSL